MRASYPRKLHRATFGTLLILLAACSPQATQHKVNDESGSSRSVDAGTIRPSKTGYANANGGRFYYEIFGDLNSGKTPLLVMHGSYMSTDSMAPIIQAFASSRPVIAFDARGHGRTGDLPGSMTYKQLADDAAGVLDALKVRSADVLGYSMGGITAITMAVSHPDKVGKQIILSGTFRRDGFYPEVTKALEQATPAAFAGSPFETAYKKMSPTPNAFPVLVEETHDLDQAKYDIPNDAVRGIDDKTMIIVGDEDGVDLEHAVELFKLRGGVDKKAVASSIMTEAPRARLAILPATTHVGMMANAELIAKLAVPFLDDIKPAMPPGFFKE